MDLTTALAVLIEQLELRTNRLVCELLQRFSKRVNAHLREESRSLYQDLLTARPEPDARLILGQFLDNTEELKRLCNQYSRKWCKPGMEGEGDTQQFLHDTRDIFRLVRQRIELENKRLLPLIAA